MLPNLYIAGTAIPTYFLANLAGLLIAGLLAFQCAGRLGASQAHVMISAVLIILGGALGGSALPKAVQWLQHQLSPGTAASWSGSSVLGVLLGGLFMVPACSWYFRRPAESRT